MTEVVLLAAIENRRRQGCFYSFVISSDFSHFIFIFVFVYIVIYLSDIFLIESSFDLTCRSPSPLVTRRKKGVGKEVNCNYHLTNNDQDNDDLIMIRTSSFCNDRDNSCNGQDNH